MDTPKRDGCRILKTWWELFILVESRQTLHNDFTLGFYFHQIKKQFCRSLLTDVTQSKNKLNNLLTQKMITVLWALEPFSRLHVKDGAIMLVWWWNTLDWVSAVGITLSEIVKQLNAMDRKSREFRKKKYSKFYKPTSFLCIWSFFLYIFIWL